VHIDPEIVQEVMKFTVTWTPPLDIPFTPVAETIAGIYQKLEEAYEAGKRVDVSFDKNQHIPSRVKIEDYSGAGEDYIIDVVFFDVPESEKPAVKKENGWVEAAAFDWETFEAERAAWDAQGITAYRYVMQLKFDIPTGPALITVGTADDPQEVDAGRWGTAIPEIYAAIEAEIRRFVLPYCPGEVRKIKITYNKQYHYPEFYSFSSWLNGESSVGSGGGFEISDFEVLTE